MKKIVLTTITSLVLFVSSATFARTDPAILNQAEKNVVTVSKAKTLADETGLTLTGTIVKHIAGDHYELKDKTGSIVIDVDDDLANGWQLKVGDKVRIVGEVDTHRIKPTEIEVLQIERVK
ncbi:DNA-binding protein [Acinetobacter nosocomialis]|uniref:NirD/YgiW/YdeI family stress tolerance protein n=1 Tax=Acinetobacter nosocomialis TaxID=106654 RepID=UPI0003102B46|nr:NirD/YgiW/YdeI family stress tolerance protein [Acinetobacter nosocomialis]AWL18753.1 DNA-binding protein [Acinetobacter nosocomialis]